MYNYSFSHANTSIAKGEGFVGFVWDDVDPQIFASVKLAGIRKRLIANLVKSIRGIGDYFPKEYLLVRVDGVDDE